MLCVHMRFKVLVISVKIVEELSCDIVLDKIIGNKNEQIININEK